MEERTKRWKRERVGCEAWMLDDHRRERKKGAGKRVARARERESKTTREAAYLAVRTVGR